MRHKTLEIMLIILFTSIFAVGTVTSSPMTEVRAPTIIDATFVPLKTFTVDITVVDVTNLYGWDFMLSFNPVVLEAKAVAMPTPNFLGSTSAWALGSALPVIDNFMGTVRMSDTFLPPLPAEGVNGTGTLATITFEVKAESAISPLTLEFTDLYTIDIQSGQSIDVSHEAINGFFNNMITLLQPVALFDGEPTVAYTSEKVTFNASKSNDPDGEIVNYRWDFNDGTVIDLPNPVTTHIYTEAGTYTVRLTVTDNNNLTDTATGTVTVQEAPPPTPPPGPGIPLSNIAFVVVAIAIVTAGIAIYFLKIRKPIRGVRHSSVDSGTCEGPLKMNLLVKD